MWKPAIKKGLALATAALLLGGCIRSKVVVTSDPPGADVTMNDVHLGRTPVEAPFNWYWYYDFKADLDGYQTGIKRERFHAPVYLWPGLDFLMEALPVPIRDTKYVNFDLTPKSDVAKPEVVE